MCIASASANTDIFGYKWRRVQRYGYSQRNDCTRLKASQITIIIRMIMTNGLAPETLTASATSTISIIIYYPAFIMICAPMIRRHVQLPIISNVSAPTHSVRKAYLYIISLIVPHYTTCYYLHVETHTHIQIQPIATIIALTFAPSSYIYISPASCMRE